MKKIKLFEELKERKAWKDIPSGYIKACRAYFEAQEHNSTGPTVNDVLFDSDIVDFANAMKDAGVKTFYIACKSTGLLDNLFLFQNEGITISGVCEILWVETYLPENKIPAIEMFVN